MEFRRIHPDPGTVTAREAVASLRLADRSGSERPHVVVNMIATLDGRAALGGRTLGMGNRADRELFHELRAGADAVLVGAGTVRAERYGPLVPDESRRARRRAAGLAEVPLACIVSERLDLPPEVPLLADPSARVLVLTGPSGELPGEVFAQVEYLRSPASRLDLGALLARLRTEHGVRVLLCEGGPQLNAHLLEAGLPDQLFLSLSPLLLGGSDPLTIVTGGAFAEPLELDLGWCLESGGHLFLRYDLRP